VQAAGRATAPNGRGKQYVGRLASRDELGIAGVERVQPEHDLEVRRVPNGEADIAPADSGQLGGAVVGVRRRHLLDDGLGQQLVSGGREGSQQAGLAPEMVRGRAVRDPGAARDVAERDAAHPAVRHRALHRGEQGSRQVAVMIGHDPS
jgi:hypothetical protein